MNDDAAQWLARCLTEWFGTNARDLLWRHDQTPYRVWVSELMLQQTRVETVTPYFERWMARFPSVAALAGADESDVLGMWAGLGYYRRARYLHRGAKYIVNELHGEFPSTVEELLKVPGVGAYTAGAVASMAFGQNVPAVDGNVERVLGRFFAIRGDLKSGSARAELQACADEVARAGNAGTVNQAMMDLGAGFCGRTASCNKCPLASRCRAHELNLTDAIPQKKRPAPKMQFWRAALLVLDEQQRILICRRRADQLLGSLWTLPMIDLETPSSSLEETLLGRTPRAPQWAAWLHDRALGNTLTNYKPGRSFIRHIFTHIDMHVTVDSATLPGIFPSHPVDLFGDAEYDQIDAIRIEPGLVDPQHPFSRLMQKLLAQTNYN